MSAETHTGARVRAIFGDAVRLSHAALARALQMRKEELTAEGDRRRLAFALTPSNRRVYTAEDVLAWLAVRDAPPVKATRPPPPPKRRLPRSAERDVIDFQAEMAARKGGHA